MLSFNNIAQTAKIVASEAASAIEGTGKQAPEDMLKIKKILFSQTKNFTQYEPRFTDAEIDKIAQKAKEYKTDIPLEYLFSQLVSRPASADVITEPLSAKQIERFLEISSGKTEQQQKNILRFMKNLQQKVSAKESKESLANAISVETYVKEPRLYGYTRWADEELMYRTNKYYLEAIKKNYIDMLKKFESGDIALLDAVEKSSDPETLVEVLKQVGVSYKTLGASDSLVKISKLSNNNGLLLDNLTGAFYNSEIKAICEVLQKRTDLKPLVNYGKAEGGYYGERYSRVRDSLIKLLKLDKDLDFPEVKFETYVDVYPGGPYDILGRGYRITGGSFERGKRS